MKRRLLTMLAAAILCTAPAMNVQASGQGEIRYYEQDFDDDEEEIEDAYSEDEEETDSQQELQKIVITFKANKGSGSMDQQTVEMDEDGNIVSGKETLRNNAFKRAGYSFAGWNTMSNGMGESFKNGASIVDLVDSTGSNTKLTLYAQWKLNKASLKTSIKKVAKKNISAVTVSFQKNKYASGYQIRYAVSKSFKNGKLKNINKSKNKVNIELISPGKTHYFQVRSYYTQNGATTYGSWSKTKSIKTKKAYTVANVSAKQAIEADVTLTGSGTGYHAKLLFATPTSAISYGIQYDACAVAPYTGKAMLMVENVLHNGAGGQSYDRPKNIELQVGKTYHLMMSASENGTVTVYLNYKKVASYTNPGLSGVQAAPRVECAGRLNGDKAKAVFKNIKIRENGSYDPEKIFNTHLFDTNTTMHSDVKSSSYVIISGEISGLGAGEDWDSAYEKVSGIVQFY